MLWIVALGCAAGRALAQEISEQDAQDPFADLALATPTQDAAAEPSRSWQRAFFLENFGFRKEIFCQVDADQKDHGASRQSAGFEVLKKFSTATATVASFDFQGRLARRDDFNPVLNDMEGKSRPGWKFEYHNAYLDFYNVANPLLSDEQRGNNVGRFNFRAGRFYVPFGLNLQTDTHGTVLQLSNEENFGFERDWYTGFWGSINSRVNYDAYYLVGSGYDLKYEGQRGLGALRLSLSNKYNAEYGVEGGISFLGGERLSPDMNEAAHPPSASSVQAGPIETERFGIDARLRRAVPGGLLTFTNELSGGRDDSVGIFTQLHEVEYLLASRRFGVATQFRRLHKEGSGSDASIIGEISWYFRNDVGNSNSRWLKLNIERQVERIQGPASTIATLQYYFYQ